MKKTNQGMFTNGGWLLSLLLLLLSLTCFAEENKGDEFSERERIFKELFKPSSELEKFKELVKTANLAGIPRQQILEARLLWGLKNEQDGYIIEMLSEIEVLAENFDLTDAAVMVSKDQIRSLACYARALKMKLDGKMEDFKASVLEALWLYPENGKLLLPLIERNRRLMDMDKISLDLYSPILTTSGVKTNFNEILAGQKALLLFFWSTEVDLSTKWLIDLNAIEEHYKKSGIVLAGVNVNGPAKLATAEKLRNDNDVQCSWLQETPDLFWRKLLQIHTVPRWVLISPEGKVLFNGMMNEPRFASLLNQLNLGVLYQEKE
jgi:hypothetical protein